MPLVAAKTEEASRRVDVSVASEVVGDRGKTASTSPERRRTLGMGKGWIWDCCSGGLWLLLLYFLVGVVLTVLFALCGRNKFLAKRPYHLFL